MKRRFLALALVASMLMAALSACGTAETERDVVTGDPYAGSERPMGSAEATDVNVGLIMGPPSMGLGWMINEAKEGRTYNDLSFELAGVDYSAVAASLDQADYDIATVPSNVAAILYNNQDLKEECKVIAIGNLGLLYILTTDPNIHALDDLKGKTVYAIGEGGPPEYTFAFLLEQAGLTKDVNFSFRPTPFEVLNLLQEEPGAVALLPQPFVEVAKLLVADLRVAIDVTEAWEANVDNGAQSVTTVTVVRKAFLEEHEQAIMEFLDLAKQSTDYCLTHLDEAAAWTEEFETFLNPAIAAEAIPACNICTVTGAEMKTILQGFLQIIYDLAPEAVGGAMPGDDFYYIPPVTE
ncbi:MAG: ABC transporter substrate-binding protein [Eubacteriales bacterium]|nr:ABC transporter substrate-binding protein [Eubacteriales bacterium]